VAGAVASADTTAAMTTDPTTGNTMTGNTMTSDSMATAPTMSGKVAIADFAFGDGTLRLAVGGSVEWTNTDPHAHSVVADDGSFQSDPLPTDAMFQHKFDAPGTYTYHCGIHPSMTGTVVVTG
jgi:plastocyanin